MIRRHLKHFLYRYIYQTFMKTNKKLLIFESNLGRNCTGNPRAIYDEMVRFGYDKEYDIVWILMYPEEVEIPGRCNKVRRESLTALKLMWQARFWVTDTRQPEYIKKNPATSYLMTWHGTPLKKLGLDLEVLATLDGKSEDREGLDRFRKELRSSTALWDYLIAPNQDSEDIFRRCFDYKKKMLCIGYPRNDDLVNLNRKEIIDSMKAKHGIPLDKRIILYTPTWRDYEGKSECDYIFKPHLDFDLLYDALHTECVFIIQYHYYIKEKPDFSRYHGFIRDIKTDIRELYLMSDLMITDYSSTMFDYSILNRPMLFYPYDIDRYDACRGFYFEYEKLVPGPIAMTTEELLPLLSDGYDYKQFAPKLNEFRTRFNAWEDGTASKKVVEVIINTLKESR